MGSASNVDAVRKLYHARQLSRMNFRSFVPFAVVTACAAVTHAQQKLELRQGDRVAIVGSAIADRIQHTGYLEALIAAKYPQADVAFRNLAVAGDEVNTWHRSQNFGSRDAWLKNVGADVIFAFYGFNESFAGYEGLPKFKENLDKFLKETAKQNYSGKGAPRIVLFSPTAAERHKDANFPDPKENNENLQQYTSAMAEVAKANGVQFVDLYAASLKAYQEAAAKGESLTINGLHLSEAGDRALAPAMFQALFGEAAPTLNEKLRAAINEKNWQWHQRYRTIDGFNVYGGRSFEKYQPRIWDPANPGKMINKPGTEPILNNTVMQREMNIRDVMTANRDARVWAIAKGGDLAVKDDNLPEEIPVYTNKPGDKPDLSHTYPDGEEAIGKMKKHLGTKVNLFADEKQFPELANPVQMAWDTRGRLWVAVWPNYPERKPQSNVGDKLIILEDTNKDGRADKCTTFLDDLNGPTGFTFHKDGVIVMQAPDLWFVRDTDGDGRGDWKERLVMGIDSADSHHTTNAMVLEPGGATFLSDGVFHRTQIETAEGPLRHSDGCLWRYDFKTGDVDLYAAYELVNPHGKVFDRWGNDLVTNATGNHTFFAPAISGRLDSGKHPSMKEFWNRPSRPCPGTGMVSSRHFPDDWQGNFLNLNVIGFQGIYRVKVEPDGSGLKGTREPDLISAEPSDLPTFRPICVSNGPDGAIYFCDWSQTIIGHLQHHLRDPNRDNKHGRVYRITYEGRPLLTPPKIYGEPIENLLELLKSHEDDTRTLAKVELDRHPSEKVIAATKQWIAKLDKNAPEYEHHVTEGLWVHQWHNKPDPELLTRVLTSPKPEARAAAVRVLCYWRNRVPDTFGQLKVAANDEDPRVRLQAVRAASFFEGPLALEAVQVAYEVLKQPLDYYLDYTFKETMRQLRTQLKEVPLPADAKALAAYLASMSDSDLKKAPEVEAVLVERIDRKTTDVAAREGALTKLAALRKTDRVTEVIAALERTDTKGAGAAEDLAKALGMSTATDLGKVRASLEKLVKSQQRAVRRAAYAALVVASGNPATVWNANPAAQAEVADSIGAIADPTTRTKFQPLLLASLDAAGPLRSAALKALPLMGAENAKNNFTVLANALREGKDRTVAAAAIAQLPRDSWNKDAAGPVVESVLAWAKGLPAGDRSKQDVVTTIQVANELAGLLPAQDAGRLRKELRGVSVPVFVVHTVHEQMRYDLTRIVVEAGKSIEIILENGDTMPHNLVIVKPGTREKVGMASSTMTPDKLDKQGRAYIPKSDDVLAATKSLEPGQKETLKWSAPKEEGEYEYVCTLPGHYVLMWGKLIVTKDVDAYLAAHPTSTAGSPGGAPHNHGK
jgi:azurin/lysophospholipase L1-like esterase